MGATRSLHHALMAVRRVPSVAGLSAILLLTSCSGSTESSNDANSAVSSPTSESQRSSGEANSESSGGESSGGESSGGESSAGESATNESSTSETSEPDKTTSSVPARSDGIELVFAEGMLGRAKLGSTIEELTASMGSEYEIGQAETVRADFPVGYGVSKDGELLFWAIEQDGVINTFMSSNPKVGLDSGIRPKLALAEAIELHGEPTLSLGPEQREFARFADGTGATQSISILVAIGDFGGPVGQYDPTEDTAQPETTVYELEDANIKELWFSAPG